MKENYRGSGRRFAGFIAGVVLIGIVVGGVGAGRARAVTVYAPTAKLRIVHVFRPTPPNSAVPTRLTLTIFGPAGRPLSDAMVTADVNMSSMDMGLSHPKFTSLGHGRYDATCDFTMAGPWYVRVHVKAPHGINAVKMIKVNVKNG